MNIQKPPKGWALLMILGPSIVWCSEYIGSGEVIIATRTGGILGIGILWAIVVGVLLKFWIGMSGAHYTVCTGEGMIDMLGRLPGPKNWAIWIVLFAQFISGAIGMSGVASASGIFIAEWTTISPTFAGIVIVLFAVLVTWSGKFEWIKYVTSLFVLLVIIGIVSVVWQVFPGFSELITGLKPQIPAVPEWAVAANEHENPWRLILPMIGWGAGGFASQVFYTYWIIGAGYGMTTKNGYGKPADLDKLKTMDMEQAKKVKGWTRVVYSDAILAVIVGTSITLGFAIAGAYILNPMEIAPKGPEVAFQLSSLFSSKWGQTGATLFLIGGSAALISTLVGQMAGWPRLVADSIRLCFPKKFGQFSWQKQYRSVLVLFLATNMSITYLLGEKPVILISLSAIFDGIILTALQAIGIFIVFLFVMPKMFKNEVYQLLKPHWVIYTGLIVAFLVFSYFIVFQVPLVFR